MRMRTQVVLSIIFHHGYWAKVSLTGGQRIYRNTFSYYNVILTQHHTYPSPLRKHPDICIVIMHNGHGNGAEYYTVLCKGVLANICTAHI